MTRQYRVGTTGLLRGAIRAYQLLISPLLPPSCRFLPTCSDYACEAIGRYGAPRGLVLAAWRLARCHPWGGSGYDPVPDVFPRPHRHPAPRLFETLLSNSRPSTKAQGTGGGSPGVRAGTPKAVAGQ
jgi:putative membrane protein insertion efficiency factor